MRSFIAKLLDPIEKFPEEWIFSEELRDLESPALVFFNFATVIWQQGERTLGGKPFWFDSRLLELAISAWREVIIVATACMAC